MAPSMDRIVQWYPGHMARAMRKIGEILSVIDVVVETVDARIPASGRNPTLDQLAGNRARLLVLDREDLAEPATTKRWIESFARQGLRAMAVDARSRRSVTRVAAAIVEIAKARRGMSRGIVVGVPNSGKSSIVNALLRRGAAKTEDRAGVTRALQWFRLSPNVELMDTPGVLVPKISDDDAQWKLSLCGAVPRDRYDPEQVVAQFAHWLSARGGAAAKRVPALEAFAAARGFMLRGGEADFHTAARSYVAALNDGTFGRFSFESPAQAPE